MNLKLKMRFQILLRRQDNDRGGWYGVITAEAECSSGSSNQPVSTWDPQSRTLHTDVECCWDDLRCGAAAAREEDDQQRRGEQHGGPPVFLQRQPQPPIHISGDTLHTFGIRTK